MKALIAGSTVRNTLQFGAGYLVTAGMSTKIEADKALDGVNKVVDACFVADYEGTLTQCLLSGSTLQITLGAVVGLAVFAWSLYQKAKSQS